MRTLFQTHTPILKTETGFGTGLINPLMKKNLAQVILMLTLKAEPLNWHEYIEN